ncbi:MAG: ATP-binding protein [Planctomycetota bacterium]
MGTGERETPPLFERRIEADPRALAELQRDLRAALERAGLDARAAYAVDFTLEELGTNTIQHGAGPLEVAVVLETAQVVVALADRGPDFDPTTHPEPQPAVDLESAAVGGLGISMLRRLVASIEHQRAGNVNRNVVRIARGAEA